MAVFSKVLDIVKSASSASKRIDNVIEDYRRGIYSGPIGYAGKDVGSEYIITIYDKRDRLANDSERTGVNMKRSKAPEIVIKALLQEKIDLATEADWAPLTAASVITGFSQELAALGGRSLANRWLSRRIWRGTSPIDFTLNLRFEAINSAMREVVMPCRELQRMSLPYVGDKALGEFFLSPPGPSPIQIGIKADGKTAIEAGSRGEIIDIKIGKLLFIRRCVVKRVNISYFPRFEAGGNPLGAQVQINFQTFEIITKEDLDSQVYHEVKTNTEQKYVDPYERDQD